jgi:hypothetical protein
MTAMVEVEPDEEPVEVPCKYEVCSLCGGRGSVVNPSIDSGGLSRADMDEMDDGSGEFLEGYMRGVYDINCPTCDGNRVEVTLNRQEADPKIVKELDEQADADYQCEMERASERAMGC